MALAPFYIHMYLCVELKTFILMDDKERYPEVLSSYESAKSTGKTSLLEYCFRFGVDYYKFLAWYRNYNRQQSQSSSESSIHLTPIHVSGPPSKKSRLAVSDSSESGTFDVVSFRLKLGNGFEISKHNTNLESILSLLEKLQSIC